MVRGDKVQEIDIKKENNETKKEYLNEYKRLCRKLVSLGEQLESLRASEESAKIQNITDMPRGSIQTDLSDYIVRLDNVLSKILKCKQECQDKKLEIEKCIIDILDGVEAQIIHKRYIEFKTWEQICVDIGYSWMQTHRLHSKALTNFKIY
jgi:DNA-directed RNA polymerase specialized sigma subunit